MRTPAGFECKYFYGNYFRGRSDEECRLLKSPGNTWSKDLCTTCPVPAIVRSNACEFMELKANVSRPFSAAFMRRVTVSAYCIQSKRDVKEPQIGCGSCHPIPSAFEVKK
ncbi:MAG: hypothetical protein WCK35_21720 [Chloroflexota bacterium]